MGIRTLCVIGLVVAAAPLVGVAVRARARSCCPTSRCCWPTPAASARPRRRPPSSRRLEPARPAHHPRRRRLRRPPPRTTGPRRPSPRRRAAAPRAARRTPCGRWCGTTPACTPPSGARRGRRATGTGSTWPGFLTARGFLREVVPVADAPVDPGPVTRALRDPRWLGGLAVAVVFAVVCVLLAQWQLDRRVQRAERNAAVLENYGSAPVAAGRGGARRRTRGRAPRPRSSGRRCGSQGRYDEDGTVLVRNRPQDDTNGYQVAVPFTTVLPGGRRRRVARSCGAGSRRAPAPPARRRARPARRHGRGRRPAAQRRVPRHATAPEGQAYRLDVPALLGPARPGARRRLRRRGHRGRGAPGAAGHPGPARHRPGAAPGLRRAVVPVRPHRPGGLGRAGPPAPGPERAPGARADGAAGAAGDLGATTPRPVAAAVAARACAAVRHDWRHGPGARRTRVRRHRRVERAGPGHGPPAARRRAPRSCSAPATRPGSRPRSPSSATAGRSWPSPATSPTPRPRAGSWPAPTPGSAASTAPWSASAARPPSAPTRRATSSGARPSSRSSSARCA